MKAVDRPQATAPAVSRSGSNIRAAVVSSVLYLNLLPIPQQTGVVIAVTALGCAWVVLDLITGKSKLGVPHAMLLLLAGTIAVGALLQPPATEYGSTKLAGIFVGGMASAIVMLLLRDRRDFTMFAWWVLFYAVIIGGAAALTNDTVTVSISTDIVTERGAAFGANPIWSSRAVVAGLMAGFWLLIWGTRRALVVVAAQVVCVAGILDLESRFAIIAVLLGLIALTISSRTAGKVNELGHAVRRWRPLPLLIVFIVTAIPAGILLSGPRITQFITNPSGSLQTEARVTLWSTAWALIQQSPGGIGIGNFSTLGYFRYPHNFFLEALLEMGVVIGLLITLLILIALIKSVVNSGRTSSMALASGLLAATVVSVSLSGDMNSRTLYAYWMLVWVAAALPPSLIASSPSKTAARPRTMATADASS